MLILSLHNNNKIILQCGDERIVIIYCGNEPLDATGVRIGFEADKEKVKIHREGKC